MQLSEQEQQRRQKLEELYKLGINPYPADLVEVTHTSTYMLENFDHDPEALKDVSFAGRIISIRDMGKAAFAVLQDSVGKIQLYIKRDEICPGEDKSLYDNVWKKMTDLGDIIGIKGYVFRTKTGEISIHVKELKLLSKSLRPLPVVKKDAEGNLHDEVTDPEQRYRMRYVDLNVNPQVRDVFRKRAKLMTSMRDYLNEKGYLEVETPVLQPLYGGAAARPFVTHHNTLDMPLYLRIANELYLKRLIVGGYDGVYEFAKDFRNEGMDRFHNPEFTQIELYVAYKDYEWMMNLVEEMVEKIAIAVTGSTEVQVGEHVINFKRPWTRFTMYEAIAHYTGVDITNQDEETMRETAKGMGIFIDPKLARGKIIDEIFGEKVEPHLIQPTFITDYPVEMSPLAKKHRTKPSLVERFEAICNGKEICNAFSELNDPIDQRKRFEDQQGLGLRGDEEAMVLDEDFLRALEYGMPPTAGLGLGIDRLTMIMTNQASIQDVLFFPQMRPEQKVKKEEAETQEISRQIKNYNYGERHKKIIQLDHLTDYGTNCVPYKDEFIDANSINLGYDDTIYRIFSIDKFKRTLQEKKLCLVRPYKWEDPFENFLLNSIGKLNDGTLVGFENIRNNYYGQCWTLKKECDGLWRNYKGKESSAIKVKTTSGKLMNQFYDLTNKFHLLSYFIGKVDYISDTEIENYFKSEIDILGFQTGVEIIHTLLIKRLSFAYEKEVRILFAKPSTKEIDLKTVANPWDDKDYFFVNIDPNSLFEEIEIDPWLTNVEYEKLKQEIVDLGFTGHITRSSLYDKPFFITKIKP